MLRLRPSSGSNLVGVAGIVQFDICPKSKTKLSIPNLFGMSWSSDSQLVDSVEVDACLDQPRTGHLLPLSALLLTMR